MREAALGPTVWPAFEGLLRADFQLFDEYVWAEGGEAGGGALCSPLTVFAGTQDARCPPAALAGWESFAPAAPDGRPSFELVTVPGPHLWPLDKACKPGWLAAIAGRVAAALGLPGPGRGGGSAGAERTAVEWQ
jgi:surfactin synthase thioesterase subunit